MVPWRRERDNWLAEQNAIIAQKTRPEIVQWLLERLLLEDEREFITAVSER